MAKLICKNCGTPYEEDQIFCNKCGNPLPLFEQTEEKTRQITCPLCKRRISEKLSTCPYCGEAISLEKLIDEAVKKNKFKSYMQLALGLGLGSFIALFFYPILALVIALTGFVISLYGIVSKTNKQKKTAIIGFAFSSIAVVVISILMIMVYLFNYQVELLPWSVQETEPPSNVSEIMLHKEKVYTAWEEVKGTGLLVLDVNGLFQWYQDKTTIDQDFRHGIFQLQVGIDSNRGKVFEDSNYYYYQLCLFTTEEYNNEDLKMDTFQIYLDKNGYKKMYLEDEDGNRYEFRKIKEEITS